jgi:hypothetical protein
MKLITFTDIHNPIFAIIIITHLENPTHPTPQITKPPPSTEYYMAKMGVNGAVAYDGLYGKNILLGEWNA